MKTTEIFENYIKMVATTCTVSTVNTYKNKLQIASKWLGDKDVEDISRTDAQAFVDNLSRRYSTKSVRSFYDVVKAAFKYAVIDEKLCSNPFADCQVEQVVQYNPVIVTKEKAEALLTVVVGSHSSLFLPILIAIETGMKRSEVLSLKWGNVNFSDSTICINRRTLVQREKTDKEYIVPMSNRLSETLLLVKNQRRCNGVAVEAGDYICLTSSHSEIKPTYLDKLFKKMVIACPDVPNNLRFQDLRWSFIKNQKADVRDTVNIVKTERDVLPIYDNMEKCYRFVKNVA